MGRKRSQEEKYSRISKGVVRRLKRFGHPKALETLRKLGFKIVQSEVISSKPYDIIAERGGLTYYVDGKAPRKTCKISVTELEGMLNLARKKGCVPTCCLNLEREALNADTATSPRTCELIGLLESKNRHIIGISFKFPFIN